GKGDDAIGRFIARDAVSEKLYGADLMACSRRKARPAFTAMIAAGTVRAAPIRNGQSCPKAENSAPAAIGPAIREAELAAMFSPSMAPCRSGSADREIRAE